MKCQECLFRKSTKRKSALLSIYTVLKMLLYYVPKKNPLRYFIPFPILELQHMFSTSVAGDK